MPEQDGYVLRGPTHRYRLGTELGRRVFHAEDEEGRRWVVKIAERPHLVLRQRLTQSLPKGMLPDVRELVDLGGGRLAFLVTEFVPGVRLRDLLVEGRTLGVAEARRLLVAALEHVSAIGSQGWHVRALTDEDVLYDTLRAEWRVVVPGELAEAAEEGETARVVGSLVLSALGDAGLARAREEDPRLLGLLLMAREGKVALAELREGVRSRRLWRGIRSQS